MANKPKNTKRAKRSKKWIYRQRRAMEMKEEASNKSVNVTPENDLVENTCQVVNDPDKDPDKINRSRDCFIPSIQFRETYNSVNNDHTVTETNLLHEPHDYAEGEFSSSHPVPNLLDNEVSASETNRSNSTSTVESCGVLTEFTSESILLARTQCESAKPFRSQKMNNFSHEQTSPDVNHLEKPDSVFSTSVDFYDYFGVEVGLVTDALKCTERGQCDNFGSAPEVSTSPDSSPGNELREFHNIQTPFVCSSIAQAYGGYEVDAFPDVLIHTSEVRQSDLRLTGGEVFDSPELPQSRQVLDNRNIDDVTDIGVQSCDTVDECSVPQPSKERSYVQECLENFNENSDAVDATPSCVSTVENISVEGRRIIDLTFFWSQLQNKLNAHACSFSDVVIQKYTDRGLRTKVYLACRNCEFTDSVWTDPGDGDLMGINKSAVSGTLTAGIGCSTLQEVLASMAIPSMSHVTYIQNRDILYNNITDVSETEMIRAAQLESELAVKDGRVIDGIPYVPVVADGAWAKRSYAGGKHDSLSGVAIIAGYNTGLVLFVGVRNKYCAFEAKAEQLGREPSAHVCFKNWDRDQSSTSMEKDIISEGFATSVTKRGLIYNILIGDGDSSVHNALVAADPYSKFGVVVRKVECNNHLFRNFVNKLRSASKKAISRTVAASLSISVLSFRSKVEKCGIQGRRLIENARDFRKKTDPKSENSCLLQKDILQILQHIIGNHEACENVPSLECSGKDNENFGNDLHKSGIYPDVLKVFEALSCHAKSLLTHVTSNVVEACNSLISKCNAGKRTNQCARNSYEIRCHTAVIQHNTQKALSKIHNGSGNVVPEAVSKLESSRQAHVTANKLGRQSKNRPMFRKRGGGADKDYGPSAEKPDRENDVYDILVKSHMDRLEINQKKREKIERETVLQSDCDQWHIYRTDLITASKFGEICRMRKTTSCSRMVMSIVQPKVVHTEALRYGVANENAAKLALEVKLGKRIWPCGLFIDAVVPYLGASPDGLIDADGIVEIKCPHSAKDTNINQALETLPSLRAIFDKSSTEIMNKNHVYYYQVQGQLHVTNRQYCIFALWSSVDLKYIAVQRDEDFWNTKMEKPLMQFYLHCVLPEIVDSRRTRSMPLREPNYILEARVEASQKKKDTLENPSKRKNNLRGRNSVKRACIDEKIDNSLVLDSQRFPKSLETAVENRKEQKHPVDACVTVEDDNNIIAEAAEIIEILRQDASVEAVIADIIVQTSLLNDSSIDFFLEIVKENSGFDDFNPACYTGYGSLVKPCNPSKRDMQIIGGNKFRHWCCVYYNEYTVTIYDSLCRSEYLLLHDEEKAYIRRRYNNIDSVNVMLMPVTRQPDRYSCGVYAAAFATTVALGYDPVDISYSRDPTVMRNHLITIVQQRKLSSFPTVE